MRAPGLAQFLEAPCGTTLARRRIEDHAQLAIHLRSKNALPRVPRLHLSPTYVQPRKHPANKTRTSALCHEFQQSKGRQDVMSKRRFSNREFLIFHWRSCG